MWTCGYNMAQAMVYVLEQCKGDFSRADIMKQATSPNGFASDVMLPGVTADTSLTDCRAEGDAARAVRREEIRAVAGVTLTLPAAMRPAHHPLSRTAGEGGAHRAAMGG